MEKRVILGQPVWCVENEMSFQHMLREIKTQVDRKSMKTLDPIWATS
jgi:hypothetical protein